MILSHPSWNKNWGLLFRRGKECIYKTKLMAGRRGSAAFKITPAMQVLDPEKNLIFSSRDSKWPWKDCGNGSYEVKIRSFHLFALETLCMMILNMHGTTVPPHYQKQHINSELITCKGKNTASARFSTSSDFPAHKNLKLTGGKLSKTNQPTGTICWSKSKLNFWVSHISGSSLSNSSKTAWLHAAFLPLKVNVPIS